MKSIFRYLVAVGACLVVALAFFVSFNTQIPIAKAQVSANYWKLLSGILQPNLSTWQFEIPQLGGSGTRCVQVNNSGLFATASAGCGSTQAVSTSTNETAGQLAYWSTTSGSPAKLNSIATTTLAGSGVVSISNSPIVIGASGAVATITGGTNGQVLGWLSGIPTWTASSSISAGTGINISVAGAVTTVNLSTPVSVANGGTATTTFYSGGVVFSDGTKLTQSAYPRLYWDNTNGNLGIGSSSPFAPLSIFVSTTSGRTGVLPKTLFAIGSSSDGVATSTLLAVNNQPPYLYVGTTSDAAPTVDIAYFGMDNLTDAELKVENKSSSKGAYIVAVGNSNFVSLETVGNNGADWKMGMFGGTNWDLNDNGNNVIVVNKSLPDQLLNIINTNRGVMGIGTTSPWAKFSIGTVGLSQNVPAFVIASSSLSASTLYTSTTTQFIVKNGQTGIGTSSPSGALAVFVATTTNVKNFQNVFIVGSTTDGVATTTHFVIRNDGTIFAPNTSSSGAAQTGYWCYDANGQLIRDTVVCIAVSARRFKTDIQPLSVGLSELLQLQPISYKLKPDYNTLFTDNPNYNGTQYSLVADDVQKIDPHLVTIETSTTTFEGITYAPGAVHGLADLNNWVGFFTKSIQDFYKQFQALVARVSGLEERINKQQAQIDNLQSQINQLKNKHAN